MSPFESKVSMRQIIIPIVEWRNGPSPAYAHVGKPKVSERRHEQKTHRNSIGSAMLTWIAAHKAYIVVGITASQCIEVGNGKEPCHCLATFDYGIGIG